MLTIRKTLVEDIPAVEAFQKELCGESFDSYHEDIAQAVLEERAWVAADENGLLGYLLCDLFGPSHHNFPNSVFLSELLVASSQRRHGLGGRLIQAALNEPWLPEYEYFSLTHDPEETHLTDYYQKFGFTEDGKTAAGNIRMVRPR